MATNPTKLTLLENDQQLRNLVAALEDARVDAEDHAQATSSFTDSDGNTYQKGANGWALDAATSATNAAASAADAADAKRSVFETNSALQDLTQDVDFTPAKFPSARIWLSGKRDVGVPTGNQVTRWENQALEWSASTAGSNPGPVFGGDQINGTDAVQFQPSTADVLSFGDVLDGEITGPEGEFTACFLVSDLGTDAILLSKFVGGSGSLNKEGRQYMLRVSGGVCEVLYATGDGDSSNLQAYSGDTDVSTGVHIIAVTFAASREGPKVTTRVDGADESLSNTIDSGAVEELIDYPSPLSIGAQLDSEGTTANDSAFTIADLLVATVAADQPEIEKYEGYVEDDWGLDILPSSHPFKTTAASSSSPSESLSRSERIANEVVTSEPFTPTTANENKLWLSAQRGISVGAGSELRDWRGQTPINAKGVSGAPGPTYGGAQIGGIDAVDFDPNASDVLTLGDVLDSQMVGEDKQFTIAVLASVIAGDTIFSKFVGGTGNFNNEGREILVSISPSGELEVVVGKRTQSGSAFRVYEGVTDITAEPHLLVVEYDQSRTAGNRVTARIDGTNERLSVVQSSGDFDKFENKTTPWGIGAQVNSDGDVESSGEVTLADLAFYEGVDRSLTKRHEGYIENDWGLDLLPQSHPDKSGARDWEVIKVPEVLVRPQRPINVREEGALGDGSADDTDALRAAVRNLNDTRAVYIPRGTYKISASIPLPSNVKVFGDGVGTTVIETKDAVQFLDGSSSTHAPFWVGSPNGPASNVAIRDLTLIPNESSIGGGGFNTPITAGVFCGRYDTGAISENVQVLNTEIKDSGLGVVCNDTGFQEYPTPRNELHKNWLVAGCRIVGTRNKAVEFAEVEGGRIVHNDIYDANHGPQLLHWSKNCVVSNNVVRFNAGGLFCSNGIQDSVYANNTLLFTSPVWSGSNTSFPVGIVLKTDYKSSWDGSNFENTDNIFNSNIVDLQQDGTGNGRGVGYGGDGAANGVFYRRNRFSGNIYRGCDVVLDNNGWWNTPSITFEEEQHRPARIDPGEEFRVGANAQDTKIDTFGVDGSLVDNGTGTVSR